MARSLKWGGALVLLLGGLLFLSAGRFPIALVLVGLAILALGLPENFLDHRPPSEDEGRRGQSHRYGRTPSVGTMTVAEAWDVLGLAQGASADDVREAHKRLIKQSHPDQGGSDYLASKVNLAKDVLLRELEG